jgi:hypothetical protein
LLLHPKFAATTIADIKNIRENEDVMYIMKHRPLNRWGIRLADCRRDLPPLNVSSSSEENLY